ncbi:hypothetical protein TNCV_3483221 [Trichonephila clavipes]|nr:hypothetical protein TNCV_3483221 [Trichonephila clavipes]
MQARTCPCRAAYSNASGFSGSVTVIEMWSVKASIWSIVLDSCEASRRVFFYTFKQDVGRVIRSRVFEPIISEKWD